MTTENKLQKVFASLTKSGNDPELPELYKMGINHAMEIIKIVFDREELEAAGINPKLKLMIDAEQRVLTNNKTI